jgi:hypothetical protein
MLSLQAASYSRRQHFSPKGCANRNSWLDRLKDLPCKIEWKAVRIFPVRDQPGFLIAVDPASIVKGSSRQRCVYRQMEAAVLTFQSLPAGCKQATIKAAGNH